MIKIQHLRLFACFIFIWNPSWSLAQEEITPEGHFKIEEPAELSGQKAEEVYRGLFEAMSSAYAQSGYPSASDFPDWIRFNKTPYLSAGHGNRYLNNYGNEKSQGYLRLTSGEKMPVGAILVKDSFTVTETQEIFPGALFIMEKLTEGASLETGDWRYAMIMPDGSVLGDTNGDNTQSMQFCHECHTAVSETDYLFLIPKEHISEN